MKKELVVVLWRCQLFVLVIVNKICFNRYCGRSFCLRHRIPDWLLLRYARQSRQTYAKRGLAIPTAKPLVFILVEVVHGLGNLLIESNLLLQNLLAVRNWVVHILSFTVNDFLIIKIRNYPFQRTICDLLFLQVF